MDHNPSPSAPALTRRVVLVSPAVLGAAMRVPAFGAGRSAPVETAQYVLQPDRVSPMDDALLNATGAGGLNRPRSGGLPVSNPPTARRTRQGSDHRRLALAAWNGSFRS
ncbi:hypothetical protein ACFYNZ_20300 [Streptomyces kebangsaanensis]|uniref:Uncharacterized protein n=1 Tax=Streptomyces kebangsaanensis TaxID=864058 RepID=A0ABW6KWQ6_9ACTN